MRSKLIAGNWKMNTDLRNGAELITSIMNRLHDTAIADSVEVLICPPFTHLTMAQAFLLGGRIKLGAQDVHYESSGAFTGEVSSAMLRSVGCDYVIVGHSERRMLFGETDYDVSKKANALLNNSLKPIICVGETIHEREAGSAAEVVTRQISAALQGMLDIHLRECTIAYEPVWAIGTGHTATPHQAQEIHLLLRSTIAEQFSQDLANSIRIIYGGSVNAENAATLFTQPDIDGALIGGASLKADSFTTIIKAASELITS